MSYIDKLAGAAERAEAALDQCLDLTKPLDWPAFTELTSAVENAIGLPHQQARLPFRLSQASPIGSSPAPDVPLHCLIWDAASAAEPLQPDLICAGGIAGSARRFDFLAADLCHHRRIIAFDWAGRGLSGWLPELDDYNLDSHCEQLACVIEKLAAPPVDVLGSSLGGAAALKLAVRRPDLIRRIVLNDTGAEIPKARRQRRARAVGRHYVFHNPNDLFRRLGAAEKNSGPVGDAVLLHNAHHPTHWSAAEQGRIYRHDPRALLAYRNEAQQDLELWPEWQRLCQPVMILRGDLSDALSIATLDRMANSRAFHLAHVPGSGHTPALSDTGQIDAIDHWLRSEKPAADQIRLAVGTTSVRRLFTRPLALEQKTQD